MLSEFVEEGCEQSIIQAAGSRRASDELMRAIDLINAKKGTIRFAGQGDRNSLAGKQEHLSPSDEPPVPIEVEGGLTYTADNSELDAMRAIYQGWTQPQMLRLMLSFTHMLRQEKLIDTSTVSASGSASSRSRRGGPGSVTYLSYRPRNRHRRAGPRRRGPIRIGGWCEGIGDGSGIPRRTVIIQFGSPNTLLGLTIRQSNPSDKVTIIR